MASSALKMVVVFLFSQATLVRCASGQQFLSTSSGSRENITVKELESDIAELQLASISGGKAADRLVRIEASMQQTFQALPKNEAGRLAPKAVRYIVHNYFAKEHGWVIKGLEPHGMSADVTEVHEVTILQENAPAFVENLLERRHSGRGLSLQDAVLVAAVLERLIFDHELTLLEAVYGLNELSIDDDLDELALHSVLQSYLLVFDAGRHKVDLADVKDHQFKKKRLQQLGVAGWTELVAYEANAVSNYNYAQRHTVNPFVPRKYNFQIVAHIVEILAQNYGKWQNAECVHMKETLMRLSSGDSGRIPLKAFYSHPDGADYTFTESPDYLRELGALEEKSSGASVLLVNYVTGPANCVSPSGYHSVCCLSDCEAVMNELEGIVRHPTADPQVLLDAVASLTSAAVDGPRTLPEDLVKRLKSIADLHGGIVHLHGRLFAEWLHYAFPNDCPYPQRAPINADLTAPSYWTATEKQRHAEGERHATESVTAEPQWSNEEVLPLRETHTAQPVGGLRTYIRMLGMAGLLFGVLQAAAKNWEVLRGVVCVGYGVKRHAQREWRPTEAFV